MIEQLDLGCQKMWHNQSLTLHCFNHPPPVPGAHPMTAPHDRTQGCAPACPHVKLEGVNCWTWHLADGQRWIVMMVTLGLLAVNQ